MRRITVVLDIGIETDGTEDLKALAHTLAEDVEMQVPSFAVWLGQEFGVRAAVKRVAVQRYSEQPS
jgi:aromatic ring-cleaving dioxygenase